MFETAWKISMVHVRQLLEIGIIFVFLIIIFYFGCVLDILEYLIGMSAPLHGSIRHPEVDLSLLFHVTIASLLCDLHGSVEVFGTAIIVALLSE